MIGKNSSLTVAGQLVAAALAAPHEIMADVAGKVAEPAAKQTNAGGEGGKCLPMGDELDRSAPAA